MRQPKFLDILERAEQIAVTEDSFEVAQAVVNYPHHIFSHPAHARHLNYLIDRAWFELTQPKAQVA